MTAVDVEMAHVVGELRDELERRDVEQMQLEAAVEFLLDQVSLFRYILGALVKDAGIPDYLGCAGSVWMLNELYPERREEAEKSVNSQSTRRFGAGSRWRRPARRWSQFGSKAHLKGIAAAAGVELPNRWDTREELVRALWAADALPGGVSFNRRCGAARSGPS